MSYADPMAKKEIRYRVNLDHYQSDAIESLARLHRKQTATYLAEIIRQHLESYRDPVLDRSGRNERSGGDRREDRLIRAF